MLKNLPANAGDERETGLALGLEDPLEEGMATHSNILAWRTHGQRSLAGYSPWGCKESETSEHHIFTKQTGKSYIERQAFPCPQQQCPQTKFFTLPLFCALFSNVFYPFLSFQKLFVIKTENKCYPLYEHT